MLVQTASGSSSAELTLEGLPEFEAVRDFLSSKMRGLKDHAPPAPTAPASPPAAGAAGPRETAGKLRALRGALARRGPG